MMIKILAHSRFLPLGLALAVGLLTVNAAARAPEIVPGQYMVELEQPPSLRFHGGSVAVLSASGQRVTKSMPATSPSARGLARFDAGEQVVQRYAAHLDLERARLLDQAEFWLGRPLAPGHVYRHVMNGFSVALSDQEAERLAAMPGVKSVRPTLRYALLGDQGPQWIRANRVWVPQFGTPVPTQGQGTVLGLIDSGINWDSQFFSDSLTDNPRGQFYGLCSDPEVQCNDKIIGVYDFTSEGSKGRDISGHGSHVGSTAVGAPTTFTLDFGIGSGIFFSTSGVAPLASVISYKACEGGDPDQPDDPGGCPGSALVAALEQAIVDQVDVVNYSIGSTSDVAPTPWAGFGQFSSDREAFLNLRAAGIVPIAAAGNSGPNDGSVSSPANAPWVVGVANATHSRVVGGQLGSLSGGSGSAPLVIGAGINQDSGVRPIVHAAEFGNALCGTGTAQLGPTCEDNTGASNPFAPGTFNGEIVVCDRGIYGRVEKGRNLLAAGAGGMILANTEVEAEDIVVEDHCLPTLHVGSSQGDRLREWLAGGSGHQGRIPASTRQVNALFGGRLAQSSGRGPGSGAPNVMKPNVTAPGTEVLGASAGEANSLAFSTGTSMASPHVAGAALLLRSAYPDWPVDAIVSALETTAVADLVSNANGSAGRIVDSGAGGVQVDQAVSIGLYLPVSEADFRAANPALGGDPGELNLPGVVSTACAGECSFQRRLRGLRLSAWSVSVEGDLDISVQPTSFDLDVDQEVVLDIQVSAGSVPVGQWGRGAIVLEPAFPGLATQRLPVGALFGATELPSGIQLDASANRGRLQLGLGQVVALNEAQFPASSLVRPTRQRMNLRQDPSNANPFDGGPGVEVLLVEVVEDTLMLRAETEESSAIDIDLFIGFDANGNGQADEGELVCSSRFESVVESCQVETPESGTWWILVQNWLASSPTATDSVDLDYAVLATADTPAFGINGPGRHAGGELTVQMFVDQPDLRLNERRWAAFGVGASPADPTGLGIIPVDLRRAGPVPIQSTALFNGQLLPVVLPAGGTHDRLFIDVPPGAGNLSVQVGGDAGVSGTLRFANFDQLSEDFPFSPPASGPGLDSGSGSAAGFELSRNNPAPGRYFVELANTSTAERLVNVQVSLSEGQRQEPRYGLWSPRFRSINQGIEWQRAGLGFMIWYSYDSAGLPVFYIAINEVDSTSSTWTAELTRATGGTGNRQHIDVVGEVSLTTISDERMMFAWRLNGAHGADIMIPDAPDTCAEQAGVPLSYTGHWFSPGLNQGGTTVIVFDEGQFYVRYYYDGDGVGRWVAVISTGAGPFADDFEVWSFQGFCPNCEPVTPDFEVVGSYQREFTNPDAGNEILDFVSRAPLNYPVRLEVPIQKLSEPLPCAN